MVTPGFRYAKDARFCSQLEDELKQRFSCSYAIATSSCTASIFLALKALDIPIGSNVATNAFTFVAVPSAIIQAGMTVRLLDINNDLRIDIDNLRSEFRANPPAALVISNIRGHISNMDAIVDICAESNVKIVEDAAHCWGATWDSKPIGTLGDVGCLSFQDYKMVRAGEGGGLLTSDPEIAAKAAIMSGAYENNWRSHQIPAFHGKKWKNKLPIFNCRFSEHQAQAALADLETLRARMQHAQNLYKTAEKLLIETPLVRVPSRYEKEQRAPDSIQFFINLPQPQLLDIVGKMKDLRLSVGLIGADADNARCFWNWEFLETQPYAPNARRILPQVAEVRFSESTSNEDVKDCIERLNSSIQAIIYTE
jgi:dTDP-4-amino-4,6-dideoxygalactose transaminase